MFKGKMTEKQKEYAKYLKTKHWLEIREEVLKRDNYQCLLCETTENINVHHKTYENIGNEKLSDLMTLCDPCHTLFHKTGYYYFVFPDECDIDTDPIYVDHKTFMRAKHFLDICRAT